MNTNKTKAPTNGRPPIANGDHHLANGAFRPATNGYTPKYIPPPEPAAPVSLPAPKVDNKINLPKYLEVTTMTDLVERIQESASIVFPSTPRLRISTALAPTGLCHALVAAPKNEESKTSRYKLVLKGPGVPAAAGPKDKDADPARARREALLALLEEVERRVGKELF
ncbi:uncharacterized protein BKA78DRAFT_315362 [Phyllosticta capitalensis]|uniref:uncharacterized protein n=1 Tax=Phyllosticta capitalensis TaxID=121624 RepID=UPI00312E7169